MSDAIIQIGNRVVEVTLAGQPGPPGPDTASALGAFAGDGGSLLIKHKAAGAGTYGRTLRQWGKLGGISDANAFNWIDDDLDGLITGGTNTNDLQAYLQTAVEARYGRELVLPGYEYLIDTAGSGDYIASTAGIVISDPITLKLHGAIIRAMPNEAAGSVLLNLRHADNVNIFGGKLIGDTSTRVSATENSHGIMLWDCRDVMIAATKVRECSGDGVFLSTFTDGVYYLNERIKLHGVTSTHNRRNNLTIQSVNDVEVIGGTLGYATGTLPKAGLDIEPDPDCPPAKNVRIVGVHFEGNGQYDVILGGGSGCQNILVADCTSYNSNGCIAIAAATSDICDGITFSNWRGATVAGATAAGVSIIGSTNVTLNEVHVRRQGGSVSAGFGLYLESGATGLRVNGGSFTGYGDSIVIASNDVRADFVGGLSADCNNGLMVASTATGCNFDGWTFRNMALFGGYFRLIDSVVKNCEFRDISNSATTGSSTRTDFINNRCIRVGTADPSIPMFAGAPEGNAYDGNHFHSTFLSQKALSFPADPTIPSFFNQNVARYTNAANALDLHADHELGTNHTLAI